MARAIPFIVCRYRLLVGGRPLDVTEQMEVLAGIRGRMVYHRRAKPTEADNDTFAMMPSATAVDEVPVLSWRVGHRIVARHQADYDYASDAVTISLVRASGVRYETFVALPEAGLVAISDRTGDIHMGAAQAVSRFQSVIKHTVEQGRAEIELAADPSDIRRALETWGLSEFSFSVRPFNPSVRRQGEKLHHAMVEEGIGTLTGKAKAAPGSKMHMEEDGFIYDAVGLADAGYGQYGVKGETPGGNEAQIRKPKFTLERRENEAQQAKPRVLRVFIEPQLNDTLEIQEAARMLLDFYDPDSTGSA